MSFLVLNGGMVFSGTPGSELEKRTVLIEHEMIAGLYPSLDKALDSAGSDVRVLDVTGMTILPGLIDCHVHLFFTGAADAMVNHNDDIALATDRALAHLHAGVTTVRDLGGPVPSVFELRAKIASNAIVGPDIVAAGKVITVPGGHCCFIGVEVRDREQLISAIKEAARQGSDCVKIAVSGGVSTPTSDLFEVQFSEPDLRAAVDTAHGLGLHVAAHASNPESIRISALAGIDSIEHAVIIDDDALRALEQSTSVVVPTLAATALPPDYQNDVRIPAFIREKAKITVPAHRDSISRLVRMGTTFATGTDAGSTLTPHGSIALEIKELVGCGLSPAEALTAATRSAARLIGRSGTHGTIEVGKVADLVAIAGDPLVDIGVLNEVRFVIKSGIVAHEVM